MILRGEVLGNHKLSNMDTGVRKKVKAWGDFDDYLEQEMSDPPPDESTALGKVPQEPRKGSMSSYARPFDLMYKLYEQQED